MTSRSSATSLLSMLLIVSGGAMRLVLNISLRTPSTFQACQILSMNADSTQKPHRLLSTTGTELGHVRFRC